MPRTCKLQCATSLMMSQNVFSLATYSFLIKTLYHRLSLFLFLRFVVAFLMYPVPNCDAQLLPIPNDQNRGGVHAGKQAVTRSYRTYCTASLNYAEHSMSVLNVVSRFRMYRM